MPDRKAEAEASRRLMESLNRHLTLTDGESSRAARGFAEDGIARALASESEPREARDVSVPKQRSFARETELRAPLARWASSLREHVFGDAEPPFDDMEQAEADWVEPARESMRGLIGTPIGEDELDGGSERDDVLRALRRLHRDVEATYSIRLPEPIPQTEVLELPRDAGWSPAVETDDPRERIEHRLAARVPIMDAGSHQYAVARSVREAAEWSGHRPGALTAYVLTGREPELPDVTIAIERRLGPPSADPGELYSETTPTTHTVLRLNEPPTTRRAYELASALRDAWELPRAAERRHLRRLVMEMLTEEERESARRKVWEPVAEEWNRGRPEEQQVGWRAVQKRWERLSDAR